MVGINPLCYESSRAQHHKSQHCGLSMPLPSQQSTLRWSVDGIQELVKPKQPQGSLAKVTFPKGVPTSSTVPCRSSSFLMVMAYADFAGKYGTLFEADVCQRVSGYGRGRRGGGPVQEVQEPDEARHGEESTLRVPKGVMLVQTAASAAPRRVCNAQCPPTMPSSARAAEFFCSPLHGVCCSCLVPFLYELE